MAASPRQGLQSWMLRLSVASALLALVVIVFGAYVRLSDAGLGCPDWPGCYGKLTPHHAAEHIAAAHAADPHGPVSMAKAWKEMGHRYAASLLGLAIIAIAVLAWRAPLRARHSPWLSSALVGVVILQGLFGMWTVTLLLKPAIVTGHLIGGLLTLALLVWLAARSAGLAPSLPVAPALRTGAAVAFVLLAVQIALGGWVSTNYAALACADLPTCQGAWVPEMNFRDAFHMLRELGQTADGELLPLAALTAIHWLHRVGALIVIAVLGALAVSLARAGLTGWGVALGAALLAQFALGVANVLLSLPLPLAAAHNAGAAALVVLLTLINHIVRQPAHRAAHARIVHEGAVA